MLHASRENTSGRPSRRRDSVPGTRAVAIAPPAYRIDLADRPVVQRREGDTYGTGNIPAGLQDHMKGEWDEKDGSTPAGGHWLPGMKSKWSTNVQLDSRDDGASDGIYFSALPASRGDLPGFTSGTRPSWYIRKGGKTSAKKTQSSFWPPSWSWGDLKHHIGHSVERAQSHQWDTTTYGPGIIKWDSTSSGTNAYPIGWTNLRA